MKKYSVPNQNNSGFLKRIFILGAVAIFSPSCFYIRVLAMAIPEKKKTEIVQVEKYEVKIVTKQGWAGPCYDVYRLKRKMMEGVFKKTISKNASEVNQCLIDFKTRKYKKLSIDICAKKIIAKTNE